MLRIATIAAIACLTVPAAHAQPDGDAAKGRLVALRLCAECHSVRDDEARSPKPDAPAFEKIANTPGMSPIALNVALKTPHRSMPNLVLEGDETADVIAYIMSLKTQK